MNNMVHNLKGRHRDGFTLIELIITISIIAILAATSIPAYSTYINKTRLLVAEINLTNALKSFILDKEYSPPSGMLEDLVVEGYIASIPNDPWTGIAEGESTGANETVDWYYENDGQQLYLYAKSHPTRLYILPSFGQPPLAQVLPPAVSNVKPTSTSNPVSQARELAKEIRKEAAKQAKEVLKEAKEQAKEIVARARDKAKGKSKSKAKKIIKDAQKQAKKAQKSARKKANNIRKAANKAAKKVLQDTKKEVRKS